MDHQCCFKTKCKNPNLTFNVTKPMKSDVTKPELFINAT